MKIHFFPIKNVKIVQKVRMESLFLKGLKYAEDFLTTITSKGMVKVLYHGLKRSPD